MGMCVELSSSLGCIISLTERLVFLLFVCWWRLGIFDENKCGKWGKVGGAGSECKLSCPTKSEVPLCVIHLQIWRTDRIKFICACCPLFLCMLHFACANPPGSLFRVYPSLFWVRWWPAGCTAAALPPPAAGGAAGTCCDLSSQHALQVRSLFARFHLKTTHSIS